MKKLDFKVILLNPQISKTEIKNKIKLNEIKLNTYLQDSIIPLKNIVLNHEIYWIVTAKYTAEIKKENNHSIYVENTIKKIEIGKKTFFPNTDSKSQSGIKRKIKRMIKSPDKEIQIFTTEFHKIKKDMELTFDQNSHEIDIEFQYDYDTIKKKISIFTRKKLLEYHKPNINNINSQFFQKFHEQLDTHVKVISEKITLNDITLLSIPVYNIKGNYDTKKYDFVIDAVDAEILASK